MYEVLVVDDEINPRNILCSCFPWGEIGFHVCGQANNGKEALKFLNEHIVHVVFTDVSMPIMNGIELAKSITELQTSKPIVVFFSAHDDFKYAQEAIRYGVRYYILKPSNFDELRESFETIRTELDIKYHVSHSPVLADDLDQTIQNVLTYCKENYRNGTLAELSETLFLNPSYLSTLIKQKTSFTFSDHLQRERMQQAKLLLQDPAVKICNISNMIGYISPNNFTRAFKLYYGMSPSEYRQTMLNSDE